MTNYLYTIEESHLNEFPDTNKKQALKSLESGEIIYFPEISFALSSTELPLLTDKILSPKHKNVGYNIQNKHLGGTNISTSSTDLSLLQNMMHRYAEFAKQLIDTILPVYSNTLRWGRTSYRPAEIKNRRTSKRKDDTRLHVDSFSASPVNGLRILRVFCNINPEGQSRIWHLGEPFPTVLNKFSSRLPNYSPLKAKLLQLTKITKTLRSPYDHYMLHLHDTMKGDDNYQQLVHKERVDFPPNSTWIVFTDQVSHAALGGQFLLEQTFYLPVTAMSAPEKSPLRQLERDKGCALI